MSVSFLGVRHTPDVANGTAARMLRAMHPQSDVTGLDGLEGSHDT